MVDRYIFSGSLPEDATTYVAREVDIQLYEGLKAGKFCYVLNSRQTGKSSLRIRTMQRLREEGFSCVAIDLSFGGIQSVKPEQWYADLLDTLIDTLDMDVDLEEWWSQHKLVSPLMRFRKLIEKVLLVEVRENIVIFIDEIDSVLSLQFPTDDFFAFIRACYNQRADNPEFKRLTFCLLGVASPSELIEDKKRTPFNIGLAISLSGFQFKEVEPLKRGLQGKVDDPTKIMKEILKWTGGQPFLTQKLCQFVIEESAEKKPRSVEEIVRERVLINWESQDEPEHLRTIRDRLLENEKKAGQLLGLYQQILVQGSLIADGSPEQIDLQLSGLAIKKYDRLVVNNPIYQQIFNYIWVIAELTKLRPTFYTEAIKAWLASDKQDESRLLRGKALQEANTWARGKSLSTLDYQFLRDSQEIDTRDMRANQELVSVLRAAQQKEKLARQKFLEAQRKEELAIRAENQAQRKFREVQKRTRQVRLINWFSPLKFMLAIIILTSFVGYRFYNPPLLTVGKISPLTIKAPYSAQFEDTKTTLEKRKEVQTGIVPILKQNEELTTEIIHELELHLESIDELRIMTAPFPFAEQQALSLASQRYIRFCPESEFKAVLASVAPNFHSTPNKKDNQSLSLQKRADFNIGLQKVALELQSYRSQISETEFNTLIVQITLTRYRYSQAWKKLDQNKVDRLDEKELIVLLDLTENEWKTTKSTILLAAERILSQGIPLGIPSNFLEQAVTAHLSPEIPDITERLSSNLLLRILKPNLEEDRDATRNIAEKAAMAINSVVEEIEQGEVIVEEGARITQQDFVLIDGFQLNRGINWREILRTATFVSLVVGCFLLIQRKVYPALHDRDYVLLCLLGLSVLLLNLLEIPYISFPVIGILVSSFYSPSLAIYEIVGLAGLVMFSGQTFGFTYLLAGFIGGLIPAIFAGRLRSREAIASFGIMVGLSQLIVYFISTLIATSASLATIRSTIIPDAIICGLFGIVWSVVAIGISPHLERLFDLITPIRLAELSNPNLPLLKRLASEAPGTFQHTMFVASLADAAAIELNCNVELVRAGTLYRDIGKIHDPLAFWENQIEGTNKHDEINDPWISAKIIKKNVSEGLIIARKYGLPKAIRDFIIEHKGTILISDFYFQALEQGKIDNRELAFEYFRYEGPIPHSREIGIVMLADSCGEALRLFKNSTSEEAFQLINNIIKARWRDKQLIDSGITYEDLIIVAEIFLQVWRQKRV